MTYIKLSVHIPSHNQLHTLEAQLISSMYPHGILLRGTLRKINKINNQSWIGVEIILSFRGSKCDIHENKMGEIFLGRQGILILK